MSEQSFVAFLEAVRDDRRMLDRYTPRNLAQLLFHARDDGFAFDVDDMTAVIGRLEVRTVTVVDEESVDGNSSLWRRMWGRTYLSYLVDQVVRRQPGDLVGAAGVGPT